MSGERVHYSGMRLIRRTNHRSRVHQPDSDFTHDAVSEEQVQKNAAMLRESASHQGLFVSFVTPQSEG